MDALDAAIIRQLGYGPKTFQWDVRTSYAKVARALGVDEDTVRARIRQLEESGIVTGWTVIIHPGLLGRVMSSIEVTGVTEERKPEAIKGLALLDGMYAIFDNYRAGFLVAVFHEPGLALERVTDLVATLCGARAEAWPHSGHPLTVTLDAADWRLIQAMRDAPRRPIAELAAAAGMSSRTVQRRLARLIEGHAVFVALKTDFSRMTGLIPVQVRVVYADAGDREEVKRLLLAQDNVIFQNVDGPMATVSYMMESVPQIEALRETLEGLPGVERVRADIQKSRIVVDRWMDEAIAGQVAATGTSG